MEHPASLKAHGGHQPVVEIHPEVHLIAAEGVDPLRLDVRVRKLLLVPGAAVVVEDDLLVEVVHVGEVEFLHRPAAERPAYVLDGVREKYFRVSLMADTSRSTSSSVL